MSDDNMSKLTRRSVLGGVAALGIGGAGVATMSETVSAGASSSLTVDSGPAELSNDRGDLSGVTVDPTLRVEWEGFDQPVGKVFVAILGKTEKMETFYPLFRMTPWLTSDGNGNPAKINGWRYNDPAVDYTKPGTEGHYELKRPLSEALTLSAQARGNTPGGVANNGIRVITEEGRPNYEGVDYGGSSYENYIDGNSIGNNIGDVVEGVDQKYVEDGALQNGYYGAVADTDEFDSTTDGDTESTDITLRYVVGFYSVDRSVVGVDDGATVTEEDVSSDWFSDVSADEVEGDNGNSVFLMNGTDGYPSLNDAGDGEFDSPSTNDYGQLYALADEHPAALADNTRFTVSVTNEPSSTDGSGESNSEAN